jgi:hypothetical protein
VLLGQKTHDAFNFSSVRAVNCTYVRYKLEALYDKYN